MNKKNEQTNTQPKRLTWYATNSLMPDCTQTLGCWHLRRSQIER